MFIFLYACMFVWRVALSNTLLNYIFTYLLTYLLTYYLITSLHAQQVIEHHMM